MEPKDFDELQQALGITHHEHSLLLDRSLDDTVDPSEAYLHDWMHGLFVDGVVNLTVYLLFEKFIQQNKKDVYGMAHDFIQLWSWPLKLQGAHLHELFDESRAPKHRKAQHIK